MKHSTIEPVIAKPVLAGCGNLHEFVRVGYKTQIPAKLIVGDCHGQSQLR
jgi:hypothetical protein